MKAAEIKEKFESAGLVQNNLFVCGTTYKVFSIGMLFGAIGGALAAANRKTYGFSLIDGQLVQTEIKGKNILADSAAKYKKADVKDIQFKGSLLTIIPLTGKKQMYQIFKPQDDMQKIIDGIL